MSAFLVDSTHIDALVALAINRPAGYAVQPGDQHALRFDIHDHRGCSTLQHDQADDLGQTLLDTNVKSINDRYPDLNPEGNQSYHYTCPPRQLTALEGLSALACYEYQASDSDTWVDSTSRQFCEELRRHLVRFIPGYGDGPWSITPGFYAPRTLRSV